MSDLEKKLHKLETKLKELSGNLDITMEMLTAIATEELKHNPDTPVRFPGSGALHESMTTAIDEVLSEISTVRAKIAAT